MLIKLFVYGISPFNMTASTDYHLNWDKFQSWAAESVKNLINDNNFADVTLVSDDLKQFKAHKIILMSSSSFFETVFKSLYQFQSSLISERDQFRDLK